MKKLSLLLLFVGLICMTTGQAQEAEWNELLKKPNQHEQKNVTAEEALGSLLKNEKAERVNAKRMIYRHETFYVCEVELGGYHFHVADYLDGTKIVTCLDGNSRGLQGISYRGMLQAESRNVQWNLHSFIHYYPGGKVTTYPNRQTADLY